MTFSSSKDYDSAEPIGDDMDQPASAVTQQCLPVVPKDDASSQLYVHSTAFSESSHTVMEQTVSAMAVPTMADSSNMPLDVAAEPKLEAQLTTTSTSTTTHEQSLVMPPPLHPAPIAISKLTQSKVSSWMDCVEGHPCLFSNQNV